MSDGTFRPSQPSWKNSGKGRGQPQSHGGNAPPGYGSKGKQSAPPGGYPLAGSAKQSGQSTTGRTSPPPQQDKDQATKSLLEKRSAEDHLLHRKWVFWFDTRQKQPGQEWGSSLKEVKDIDSVESFWSLYNNMPKMKEVNGMFDIHMFAHGVRPTWEHDANKSGGKWVFNIPRDTQYPLDEYWLVTLLACIGEQFDDEGEEICGVVCNLRKAGDKISVWTRNYKNKDAILKIGKKLRTILDVGEGMLGYQSHEDTKLTSTFQAESMYKV